MSEIVDAVARGVGGASGIAFAGSVLNVSDASRSARSPSSQQLI